MISADSESSPGHVMIDVSALLLRKRAIESERAPLVAKLGQLDEEQHRIDVILSYASDTRFTFGQPLSAAGGGAPKGKERVPRVTHRVICLLALDVSEEGASVTRIVNWGIATGMADKPVTKTSISPLLKKLADPERRMMEVEHDQAGRRWIITDKGRATADAFRREWIEAGCAPFWEAASTAADAV